MIHTDSVYCPPFDTDLDSVGDAVCMVFVDGEWQPSPGYIACLGKVIQEKASAYAAEDDERMSGVDDLVSGLIRTSLADIEMFAFNARGYSSYESYMTYSNPDETQLLSRSGRYVRLDQIRAAYASLNWITSEPSEVSDKYLTFEQCCDLRSGSPDPASMRETFLRVARAWLKKAPVAVEALKRMAQDPKMCEETATLCV